MTFSTAMNDNGFELLSDWEIDRDLLKSGFRTDQLQQDILADVNAIEMARKSLGDVASIGELELRGSFR